MKDGMDFLVLALYLNGIPDEKPSALSTPGNTNQTLNIDAFPRNKPTPTWSINI